MTFEEAIAAREKGAMVKHTHFPTIYDAHLYHLQDKPLKMLELGIYHGGSLYTWKKYFPKASIIGVDIDPNCAKWADDNIVIEIGDQNDENFLEKLVKMGKYDIVIDDASHISEYTIKSFEYLFPVLNEGGYYIIEDTYFAFQQEQSPDPKNTTTEYFKKLSDGLNSWAYKKGHKCYADAGIYQDDTPMSYFEKNIFSITFYDSMIVIYKLKRPEGVKSYGQPVWYGFNGEVEVK